ncbi:MAG: hypothetical protein ABJ327_05185 [Litoreibacter sp.]
MRISIKIALICAVGLALTACTTDRREFVGLSVTSENETRAIAVVRHLSVCPTETTGPILEITPASLQNPTAGGFNKRSAIGSAAIAIGVDFAIETASIGLARANANRNGSFLATGAHIGGPEQVIQSNGTKSAGNGCIVVYHGPSGPMSETPIGEGLRTDIVGSLGLSDQPAFYLELKSSVHNGARVLHLNNLQYAATSALSRGSGHKTVTVALGFGAPKKSSNDPLTGVEVYLFNLGQLKIGSTYLANPSQVAVSAETANGTYNMVAKVSESQDPSVALDALATAFDSNKSALAGALKEALQ